MEDAAVTIILGDEVTGRDYPELPTLDTAAKDERIFQQAAGWLAFGASLGNTVVSLRLDGQSGKVG